MATLTLGERLRSLRVRKGISLRELARRAGLSASFLSGIETSRRYPSEQALERLANELGVTAAGLRKLDMRSQVSVLKELLAMDPAWGPVFQQLAKSGRSGKLSPDELLKKLGDQ